MAFPLRVSRVSRVSARRTIASLLIGAMTAMSLPAFAQTDEDKSAARQMAIDGKKAYDEKKYAEAVDYFTRAESLVHSPAQLLYLARAQVGLGKLVKAKEAYLKIKKETLAPTAPKAFVDAQNEGTKELAALEPRIPSLKITVAGNEGKAVVVTMDDAVVPAALIGVARPMDPGEHKVSAKADGLSFETPFTLKEGANDELVLTLKADGKGTAVVDPKPPVEEPKPPPVEDPKPPTDTAGGGSGGDGLRIGSYAAFGVGAVGLGLSLVFMLKANSKKKDADALCPNGVCPLSSQGDVSSLDDQSKSARGASGAMLVLGVLGVGAGVTLFVLAGSADKKSATGPSVQPWIGLGSAGLSGSF